MTGHAWSAAAASRCANVVLPAPPQPSMPTSRTGVVVARISSTSRAYVRIAVIHTSVAHQHFSSYLSARIHGGGARRNVRGHRLARQAYCKGLCEPHYRRQRRTGSVWADRAVGEQLQPVPCKAAGCGRDATERGYCHSHYLRLMRTGDIREDRPLDRRVNRHCTVDGCDNKATARGVFDTQDSPAQSRGCATGAPGQEGWWHWLSEPRLLASACPGGRPLVDAGRALR